jgi:hypothetical protein
MATPLRVTSTYAKATAAFFKHLHIAVPVSIAVACITAPIDRYLWGYFGSGHENMLAAMLSITAVYLMVVIFIGPLLAATAIYAAKKHWDGKSAGLYPAVNFALNRYKKMFLPHLGAQLSIQIGMQVIIPGILFLCMYAFVDAVACLEDEKWPLQRSKKLTRNRRKTILWVALPYLLFMFPKGLIIDPAALELGLLATMASHTLSVMFDWWLALAFGWMYLTRISGSKSKKTAEPAAEPAAG